MFIRCCKAAAVQTAARMPTLPEMRGLPTFIKKISNVSNVDSIFGVYTQSMHSLGLVDIEEEDWRLR